MKKNPLFLILTILLVGGVSFLVFFSNQTPTPRERVWPIKDWVTSTPQKQGMDPTKLDAMTRWVEESGVDVDSLVIVRHGYMVYERYFNPNYGVNSTHILHSASKSFTSAIVGVAVDRGLIHLDEKVLDYFPEMTIKNRDPWKEAMTVRDLLTMTAGLQWDEWSMGYASPINDLSLMRESPDPYQFLLDRPMVAKPGEKWVYNTGITDLLTEIVRRATGSDFLEYGVENLFRPLNFTRYFWLTDAWGRYLGGSTLCLTTREMAKFGYLYLNNGTWNGKVVLSPEWVSESVSPIAEPDPGAGYGYQWWSYPDLGVYYASGRHEQSIYVSPSMDLVIAITGNVTDEHASIYSVDNTLLNRYILPACPGYSQAMINYQKNNVTFTYPAGAYFSESENGSMHQIVWIPSNECNILGFGKIAAFPTELSQEQVQAIFKDMVVSEEQSDYALGNLTSLTSGDRRATLQTFTMKIAGSPVEGAIAYWYCPDTNRHFIMLHLRVDETLEKERVIDDYKRIYNNMICH